LIGWREEMLAITGAAELFERDEDIQNSPLFVT
jgi:hypothetical protein